MPSPSFSLPPPALAILREELSRAPREEVLSRALAETDRGALFDLLRRHSLAHLLSDAALRARVYRDDAERRQYARERNLAIFRYTYRDAALTRIGDIFEREGIPYLPIKGAVLQDLWPEPWMRSSCDIDIFVPKEHFSRARKALTSAGFRYLCRSSHDISLEEEGAGQVRVELHFDTIEKESVVRAHLVLQDLLSYASPAHEGSCRLVLSPEMVYFYAIAHMAKHFEGGGCGIRPFLDLYLMEEKLPLRRPELDELLERGGLRPFRDACVALVGVWMRGELRTDLTSRLEDFILRGGTFGSIESMVAVRHRQREHYLLRRLFPRYDLMRERYPVLQKFPPLLPFCYLHRIAMVAIEGRAGRAKVELDALASERALEREGSSQSADLTELLASLGLLPEKTAPARSRRREEAPL